MPILAIESATERPSVALVEGDRVVAQREAARAATRSETLLPAIEALLTEADVALAALSGFAIGIGPGSFTGLRVGLATLKGLAFADPRPVAAVSTLAAVARGAGEPRPDPVLAVLDARRGEVYAAGFAAGAGWEPDVPEGLYTPEALVGAQPDGWAGGTLVGEVPDALAQAFGAAFRVLPLEPAAGHVGALGARHLAAGQGVGVETLVPRYVRRAEAEAQRTGRAVEPRAGRS